MLRRPWLLPLLAHCRAWLLSIVHCRTSLLRRRLVRGRFLNVFATPVLRLLGSRTALLARR
jgi:hypothetical protein